MHPFDQLTRRAFLGRSSAGLGAVALATLLNTDRPAAAQPGGAAPLPRWRGVLNPLHIAPKAKRVIWLYMAGGPSHLETLDYKPVLARMSGQPMPESYTRGQPIAQLQGQQLRCLAPQHRFRKFGRSGQEIADIFPHLGTVADELCIVRSLRTEAINHDPAHTFMNTGSTISGRPAMGSWLYYGLGCDSEDLPGFVVLTSTGRFGQSADRGAAVAQRFPAEPLPGHPPALDRRPGAVPVATCGRGRRAAARRRRCGAGAQPHARPRGGRPRDRDAHRPVRTRLPHADQRAAVARFQQRAAARPRP